MSNTATRPCPSPEARMIIWRDLYMAALFETNREKLPARIAEAAKAIGARSQELFSTGSDTIEEDQALDDALYALRALQSCLDLNSLAA